ncbi:hypothetical protein D039_0809B, partial [Vibrio parahaemolyticus EKP-028]
RSASSDTEW